MINPGSLGCTWEAEPLASARVCVLQLDSKHSKVDHPLTRAPIDRDRPALAATNSLPFLIPSSLIN